MSQATNTTQLTEQCQDFLRRYYHEEVGKLATNFPRDQRSISVDWMDLWTFERSLAEELLEKPDQIIPLFEEALRTYDLPIDIDLAGASVAFENARHEALSVGALRSTHINEYVAINGQATKTSAVRPQLEEAAFECQRCGTFTYIPQATEGLMEPHECDGCERQGPFVIDYDRSTFVDHQVVRLQEPPERTKGGDGEHIDVNLIDGLVGAVSPGDRVDLSGIMRVTANDGRKKKRRLKPFLDGRAVELEETDFEEVDVDEYLEQIEAIARGEQGDPFELLGDSLAPTIIGLDDIKEALILQMFGGVQKVYEDGTTGRGDSHVLLIGDPGCGKSMLLEAVNDLAPRSVYAEGNGLSKAGATAAAVRDDFGDTEWGLKAGALVLANKGVACIDELDKVDDEAVSSLHGAMERQRVEINKAGIDATLPAQTAVLAAANPIYGRFDQFESIPDQFDLLPTLVSRFDLIFPISDVPEKERDQAIARHVIQTRREGVDPPIPRELFRAYVAYAKQRVFPSIEDDDVEDRIVDFYSRLRGAYERDGDAPVPVTARKLEGIVRLAQASARVRLSPTVEVEDIKRATKHVQKTMHEVGMDPDSGKFDADVIETGMSKSQRDRVMSIRKLIDELTEEYADGVPIEEVLARAAELGMDEEKAEHEIETLKTRGEVYEPKIDHLLPT